MLNNQTNILSAIDTAAMQLNVLKDPDYAQCLQNLRLLFLSKITPSNFINKDNKEEIEGVGEALIESLYPDNDYFGADGVEFPELNPTEVLEVMMVSVILRNEDHLLELYQAMSLHEHVDSMVAAQSNK